MKNEKSVVKRGDKWVVFDKKLLPNVLMLSPSSGQFSYTYCCVPYEVQERKETKTGEEYRTRVVWGQSLYAHENRDHAILMTAAIPLVGELRRQCELKDRGSKK